MDGVEQYWMQDIETAPRSDLARMQLEKLKNMLAYSQAHSRFYQKKFQNSSVSVSDLQALEDIVHLPLTSRDEIVNDQMEYGRLGSLMCTNFNDPGQTIGMSGVRFSETGRPIRVIESAEDAASQGRIGSRGLFGAGVRPHDYLYVMDFPQFNLLYMHVGLGSINLGSKSLLVGMERAERNTSIYTRLFPPTAFYISPTYSKFVTRLLSKTKRKYPIRTVLGWSEPGYSLPSWKERYRQMWQEVSDQSNIAICDVYGMVEVGLLAFECISQTGLHGFEDSYVYEIIDPDTGDPLPPGEEGELVVTHLEREGMPLIRYRTGDVTCIHPDPCSCGRTHVRLMGIKGRLSQALTIAGKRIYQSQIEEAVGGLRSYSGEFNVISRESDELDCLELNILKDGVQSEAQRELEEACSKKLGVPVRANLKTKEELLVFVHRSQKIFGSGSWVRLQEEIADQQKYET